MMIDCRRAASMTIDLMFMILTLDNEHRRYKLARLGTLYMKAV